MRGLQGRSGVPGKPKKSSVRFVRLVVVSNLYQDTPEKNANAALCSRIVLHIRPVASLESKEHCRKWTLSFTAPASSGLGLNVAHQILLIKTQPDSWLAVTSISTHFKAAADA